MNYVIADNIEAWMLVDGYDNYEVSSIGRVRNNVTGRILRQHNDGRGYLKIKLCKNGDMKNHKVHRLVAEAFCKNPNVKKYVDHIDNNRANNHYTNLRWVSSSENNRNKQVTSSNTSGYVGVSWHKQTNKWSASYKLNYKKNHLGYFNTKEDAGRAYDRAVLEVDPEHCVLNFPIPQKQKNVYISYHTLKTHLAELKSIIDGFGLT